MRLRARLVLLGFVVLLVVMPSHVWAQIQCTHHDGQTFTSWTDPHQGAAGGSYRFSTYRQGTLTQWGIPNRSANLDAGSYTQTQRQAATAATVKTCDTCAALQLGSGLAVHTATANETGVAYEVKETLNGTVTQSVGSCTIDETVAPIKAILQVPAAQRGTPIGKLAPIPSEYGLLGMNLTLHASAGNGAVPDQVGGDLWLVFGDRSMGYRDGQQFVWVVQRWRASGQAPWVFRVQPVDTVLRPDGLGPLQQRWCCLNAVPQWATDQTPRAYPFGWNRLNFLLQHLAPYNPDPNRWYLEGTSMGAHGGIPWMLHNARTLFAAAYECLPKWQKPQLGNAISPYVDLVYPAAATMPDGSSYWTTMDSVALLNATGADYLPHFLWFIGQNDGWATWAEQLAVRDILKTQGRGFAWAWDGGGHGCRTAFYELEQAWAYDALLPQNWSVASLNMIGQDPYVTTPGTERSDFVFTP